MAEYMGMAEYYAEYLPALSLSNILISGLSVNPVMSKSTALVNQNENNNVCCNKNGGYYLEPGNNFEILIIRHFRRETLRSFSFVVYIPVETSRDITIYKFTPSIFWKNWVSV